MNQFLSSVLSSEMVQLLRPISELKTEPRNWFIFCILIRNQITTEKVNHFLSSALSSEIGLKKCTIFGYLLTWISGFCCKFFAVSAPRIDSESGPDFGPKNAILPVAPPAVLGSGSAIRIV